MDHRLTLTMIHPALAKSDACASSLIHAISHLVLVSRRLHSLRLGSSKFANLRITRRERNGSLFSSVAKLKMSKKFKGFIVSLSFEKVFKNDN